MTNDGKIQVINLCDWSTLSRGEKAKGKRGAVVWVWPELAEHLCSLGAVGIRLDEPHKKRKSKNQE